MTEEPKPWVGDQVWDEVAEKEGVVTDVKNGVYELRPPNRTWGETWTVLDGTKLRVTVSRQERLRRRREEA
ncbi:hypothetical protein [Streptomyces apricus]|uniref:Uncharacterized protein n=1 Tax=Streptomyces apricus TaxID=1828112 RepID=A0A5B0BJJ9_9ACTN|nr:hypothetical protein [Streptomyces apricus]KAA0941826.1 hypothetical protein FGF04_04520 [Streptomyces apricus]